MSTKTRDFLVLEAMYEQWISNELAPLRRAVEAWFTCDDAEHARYMARARRE